MASSESVLQGTWTAAVTDEAHSLWGPDAQSGGGRGTILGSTGIQRYVTCSLGAWDAAELRNGRRGLPFC